MILFHGSYKLFKELDPKKARKTSNHGKGIYLTENRYTAKQYARPWFYFVHINDNRIKLFNTHESVAEYFDEFIAYVLNTTGFDLMGDDFKEDALWRHTGPDEEYAWAKPVHDYLVQFTEPRDLVAALLYDVKADFINIDNFAHSLNGDIMAYSCEGATEKIAKACKEFDGRLTSYAVNTPNSQQSDDVYLVKDKSIMHILAAFDCDNRKTIFYDDEFRQHILDYCHEYYYDCMGYTEDEMIDATLHDAVCETNRMKNLTKGFKPSNR